VNSHTGHQKRVALYLRVSHSSQVDGNSLEDQEHICRKATERLGWTVTRVYSEPGRSAFIEKLEKRVAFQQMLHDAATGSFDVVMVYKLNRFARKVLVQYQAAAQLEKHNVQIASATEEIDRRTASGRLNFGMLALMAEAQSDQLSEKMRDTRLAEARNGRHVGPVPVGYQRRQGVLIPLTMDEAFEQACNRGYGGAEEELRRYGPKDAVIQAFRLYADKQHSFETVCEDLTRDGWRMPNGNLFTKFQMAEMLRNPVYIGVIRSKETDADGNIIHHEFPGAHEPLIDQETWDTVQAELDRRAAKPDHSHRAASKPSLLSELARCAECKSSMWRGGRNGNYYLCSRKLTRNYDASDAKHLCSGRATKAAIVDTHVLASLAVLACDSEIVKLATQEIDKLSREATTARFGRDARKIKEQIRRTTRAYELGAHSDDEYAHMLNQLRGELAQAESPSAQKEAAWQKAKALLANVPALLSRATDEERRALVLEVFDEVYLTPHHVVAVRPAEAYAELLREARERLVEWAGWAPDPRDDTLFTFLLPRRLAA
jgi:site-specific DNA recombinase